MPLDADAGYEAAAREAMASLSAIECALVLLRTSASSGRERELLRTIDDEVLHVRHLIERIVRR